MVLNWGLGKGRLVIGLCLRPGVELAIRICAVVEPFPFKRAQILLRKKMLMFTSLL